MNKVFLLLAKHGPNDKGHIFDVYLTNEDANMAVQKLEERNREFVDAINSGDMSAIEPPHFTATLVVEEREVKGDKHKYNPAHAVGICPKCGSPEIEFLERAIPGKIRWQCFKDGCGHSWTADS